MNLIKTLLILVCAVVFSVGVALAQQPMTFEQVDANSDGAVNKEEAASVEQLIQAFDTADADQNGSLNKAEFETVIKPE